MLLYLIQMTTFWVVGWLLYQLLLSKETFHQWNRFYLLSIILLGITLPLLEVASPIATIPTFLLPEQVITASALPNDTIATITSTRSGWTWSTVFQLVYLLGVLFGICRLCKELYTLFQLKKTAFIEQHQGYTWVQASSVTSPFSFFKFLFWAEAPYQATASHQYVLRHELAHIRQWHSVDKLLLQLLSIVLWWHPFVYVFKYNIEQLHEFLADEAAVASGNKKSYGQLLLSYTTNQRTLPLTNTFIKSPLKNRILMLLQPVSSPINRWKYFGMLPFLVFTFFACQQEAIIAQADEVIETAEKYSIDTIIVFDPATNERSIQIVKNLIQADEDEDEDEEVLSTWEGNQQDYTLDTIINFDPETYKETVKFFRNYGVEEGAEYLLDTLVTFNPETYKEIVEFAKIPFYKEVDEMPFFGDCGNLQGEARKECSDMAMLNYVYSHVLYPEAARKQGKEGTAVAQFVIRADGFIANLKIVKSVSPEIDAEVLRMVQTMPKWTPGKKDGKIVSVQFVLPVKFKLE